MVRVAQILVAGLAFATAAPSNATASDAIIKLNPGGSVKVDGVSSNNSPSANDDSVSATRGETLTIDVVANDTDPDGDSLSIASVGSPSGSASISGDKIDYTAPGSGSSDSFSYTVSDGEGGNDNATITVSLSEKTSAGFGEPFRGGICAETDGCDQYTGIIVARDHEADAYLGTDNYATGATEDVIPSDANHDTLYAAITDGDGTANPDDGKTPNAVVQCENKVVGSYANWYLPIEATLNKLKTDMSDAAEDFGFKNDGPSKTDYYWSSTERSSTAATAMPFSAADGSNYLEAKDKSKKYHVRCVRKPGSGS